MKAKRYVVNCIQFTQGEYDRIMAAMRLREESCDDNPEVPGERQKAAHWRKITRKLILAFHPEKESQS